MSRSLRILFCVVALAVAACAEVQTWNLDPNHSAAQFSVRHMGISTVRGAFTKLKGTAAYDPADASKTSIDVTIETGSVDTRVDARDKDLRSPNYFDADKYPTITFKSKSASADGAGKMKITGDLTIKGVTKEVVLDVEGPSAPMKDPRGNEHMGASATTKVNRKDFGVGGASPMIGEDINIILDVEMVKPAAAPAGK